MHSEATKQELNEASEAAMRTFLRSKSWPEKVRSIERMNRAAKIARASMIAAQDAQQTAIENAEF